MRSLEAILVGKDNVKREVLFEEGEWCLYKRPSPSPSYTSSDPEKGGFVYNVIHRCSLALNAVEDDGDWQCECGQTAPDSVKTLHILQTWNR